MCLIFVAPLANLPGLERLGLLTPSKSSGLRTKQMRLCLCLPVSLSIHLDEERQSMVYWILGQENGALVSVFCSVLFFGFFLDLTFRPVFVVIIVFPHNFLF